jgi:molybdate transport system substrate-binding protein
MESHLMRGPRLASRLASRLALCFLAALSAPPAEASEITVFAAASLKLALDEVAEDWGAATGNRVILAYGGSSGLARQIEEGAPADAFISASTQWMDWLDDAGLIRPESRRDLLGNRLILVSHAALPPVAIDAALDLPALLDGGKLSMALVDAVPAGQYGKEALETLGLWDAVKDSVAQSENVSIALKLVALGEAPLGIVYASDAVAETGVTVIGTFPEETHRPIVYPAAVTAASTLPEASDFLDHLGSAEAQAVFLAHGFKTLP